MARRRKSVTIISNGYEKRYNNIFLVFSNLISITLKYRRNPFHSYQFIQELINFTPFGKKGFGNGEIQNMPVFICYFIVHQVTIE